MSKSDTYKLLFQFYQQICNHASTKRKSSRSEEHTSELQSRLHLVCRLLLEKKKNTYKIQSRLPLACRPLIEKKHNFHHDARIRSIYSYSTTRTHTGLASTRRYCSPRLYIDI